MLECAGPSTLSVLIGNTKNVWEPFLKACAGRPEMLDSEHPFDAYVEAVVTSVVEDLQPGCGVAVRMRGQTAF